MVTERGGFTGCHLSCLVSGFDVFEIALMGRVGYFWQGQYEMLMGYALTYFLWIFSIFCELANLVRKFSAGTLLGVG